jgi:hypothetical protein
VIAAKQVGERLFDAVFAGPVGECLRRSTDRAREQQTTLRIRLRLADCPDLADLPWELLYDRRDDWFLALSGHTPVVRYVQLPDQPRAIQINLPLRILVIKSEPVDCPPLDLTAEWEQVAGALVELRDAGLVAFTELTSPTLGELRRALLNDTFHVLHYMGHGAFDQQNGGMLLFADRVGHSVPVTGGDLGVMLRDHTSMRLAVLNACEAGRTDPTDPFAGVADTLVRRGIPAVVAMQFEVTDVAAVEFAPALYGALAAGRPVDVAVAEARKAMYTVSPIEWATPVLYLRGDDARLFDITGHGPAATANADYPVGPIRGSGVTMPPVGQQPDGGAHGDDTARGDSATQGKPQPAMARVPDDTAGRGSRVTAIPRSRPEPPWNIPPNLQRGIPRNAIVMWGAPASGKTTFLAALNIAIQQMNGDWSFVAENAASEEALVRISAELAGKGAFPMPTSAGQAYQCVLQGHIPVAVRRMFRKEQRPELLQILLEFADVPDMASAPGQEELAAALLRSHGILYMFDPVREFEVGDAYERVTGICNQLRRNMMGSRPGDGRLPHYLAVCITKFDESSVLEQARALNLLTVDPSDSYAIPRVQDDNARELFRHLCHVSAGRSADMLATALERCFFPERIKYFVTSAVGFYSDPLSRIFNPNDSQNVIRSGEPPHARIRGSIHPINVAEPLLWLTRQFAEHVNI